jgi:hypothetical protein
LPFREKKSRSAPDPSALIRIEKRLEVIDALLRQLLSATPKRNSAMSDKMLAWLIDNAPGYRATASTVRRSSRVARIAAALVEGVSVTKIARDEGIARTYASRLANSAEVQRLVDAFVKRAKARTAPTTTNVPVPDGLDLELLDAIAQNQIGRPYKKATPAQRETICKLAALAK